MFDVVDVGERWLENYVIAVPLERDSRNASTTNQTFNCFHIQLRAVKMPPKRGKATDPEDAPEPKKRVTRSSTKATRPNPPDVAEPEPKKTARKTAKPKKSEASSSKKAKAKEPKAKVEDEPSQGANGSTSLTITHDLVKNPITCQHYTPKSANEANDRTTFIFTHGAGGTLSADAVVNFCTGYSTGASILAFQGSMNLKARTKGFHACISHLETTNSNAKSLVLGGRSMGARAAVIATTEHLASSSKSPPDMKLILVSYPLKGPKDDIRDQILLELPASVGVLFVIGDKDAMCPLELLDKTRKKMTAKSRLVVVKGADHGMHVKGKDKEKKAGEETGMRAWDWVSGEMDGEMVEITGEKVE